jgi:hypothetical protein
MRTYKTVSVTFPPALFSRATAIAEEEHRSMSELLREAFRVYDRLRPTDSEDKAETGRRIKRSLANVRRGEYTDYDEEGLRGFVKQVIAELETEKRGRKKRG